MVRRPVAAAEVRTIAVAPGPEPPTSARPGSDRGLDPTMRSDRFRRRTAEKADLTATIAEARSRRVLAGFLGLCGLSLTVALALTGIAIAIGTPFGGLLFGLASAAVAAVAIWGVAVGLKRGGDASTNRSAAIQSVVVLLVGLAAAGVWQGLSGTASPAAAQWLPCAAAFALVAATLVPWTSAQAAAATAPAFLAWLPLLFLVPNSSLDLFAKVAVAIAGAIVACVPIGIGLWNERRFEEDEERAALSREVSHTREELGRARIVHDAMFKPPLEEGPVEVTYRYDPLREIGGDFVHILRDQRTGRVTTTIIDVSGHGLAAALTVNRLFGELERVIAEAKGDVTPAGIMTQLNRYIHLTMSAHSMFATAACVQVDPEQREVRWVVAGHPPPFLRHRDGAVERLQCTTLVLGAADPEEFEACEERMAIAVGDCVILYTDGAFEARNGEGQRFGLKRLEESVAFDPPPRDFPTFLSNLVSRHHEGAADDDLLVVQITFRGSVRTVAAPAERAGAGVT